LSAIWTGVSVKDMTKNSYKKSFGTLGEKIACEFLNNNRYEIIAKNFRAGRLGEIDIIARENEYICFIEVKSRTGTLYGMPSEAIGRKKQEYIRRLASLYAARYFTGDICMRFDVVEIIFEKVGSIKKIKEINLIKNAF